MSIYDPAEEQREIALLKAKLSEKGRAFNEALLMQGAEIAALRATLAAAEAKLAAGPWDAWRNAEAEVERFRDEVVPQVERKRHDAMAEIAALRATLADAEAEVERLKAECDAAYSREATLLRAALRGEGEK